MDKKAVARFLGQIGSLMELKGENTFPVRAFTTAARSISGLSGELQEAIADGTLAETKGIGPATLQIVTELANTGRSTVLEELREQVPPGLLEMLQISGLGVAKIRQIHETLDIDSLPELEAAARDGRLAKLPRFGAKTADNILKGIAFLRQAVGFKLSHHAAEEAAALQRASERPPGVPRGSVAGGVRAVKCWLTGLLLVRRGWHTSVPFITGTSRPANRSWPDVGGTSQVSILKKVLFPAPFGPMMPRSSPRFIVKSMSALAITPP